MEKKETIIGWSHGECTVATFENCFISSDERKTWLIGRKKDSGDLLFAPGGRVVFMFVFQ